MVAYSFQKMFIDPILIGRKVHTVRGRRKRHARPGEQLQLYTGMRTKACRLLARAWCRDVLPIEIHFQDRRADDCVVIGERRTDGSGLDEFAYSDGFADWLALLAFWQDTHGDMRRFDGVIVYWRDLERFV